MAITAQRFTVSTTATALNVAESDTVSGARLHIVNTSANAADLGPSTVTANSGYSLAASAAVVVELGAGDQLYAIRSGASDATLAVLRVGV
jgi:hypothetical protein